MNLTIPERYEGLLRLGTCSWKYDSWKGLLYDQDKRYRAREYLPDFARHLDSVEVDQWFWSLFPGAVKLPEPRTVAEYAESVPPGFLFSVKAPNALTLTHFYSKQPKHHKEWAGRPNEFFLDVELFTRFLALLNPLGEKLGPVMLQFEYLNKKKMPSFEEFLKQLHDFFSAAPPGHQYAVEIRNPNYLRPRFFDLLQYHQLGFVFLDGYYMPPLAEVSQRCPTQQAAFCVLRLHGGDRQGIEKRTGSIWNQVVAPQPQGLESAVSIARTFLECGKLTIVNANNHYEGSAPLTLERFLDRFAEGEDPER